MLMFFRPLPWEYATRNLFRRPLQTLLTFTGLTAVLVLVLIVIAFIRGLDHSLSVTGDPNTALIFALGMGDNMEYSSIPMRTGDLVAASVLGVQDTFNQPCVSPELYLGTQVLLPDRETGMGLVRGVTPSALLVRRRVELISGSWPGAGEAMVGRLATARLKVNLQELESGVTVRFEGRDWKISGIFSAEGSAFESEIWCPLDDLQQAMKRQDLSVVSVTMSPEGEFADLDLFCKERLDLELQAIQETDYYAMLQRDYSPIRWLAWMVILLVSAAGILAGLNTMHGAVLGRLPELATLQTLGFSRRALILSLIQEGLLLASSASLLAAILVALFFHGTAVRFTMGAFRLHLDSTGLLIGCLAGFSLGLLGSLPAALRLLRLSVIDGLKAV